MHKTRRESGKETLWSQMERSKSLGETSFLRTSTWNPGLAGTRRRTGSSSQMNYILPSPTSRWRLNTRWFGKAKNDFWSMSGEASFIVITLYPRVKLYVPGEESFPIPMKYIKVTRTTQTSLDVYCWRQTYWWQLERGWRKRICQMHGQASQDSSYWTKGHLMDTRSLGGDLRGNKQPQDPTMYGQICGSICLMHRNRKAKQRWAIEKPKLDNARLLRGNILHRTKRWRIQAHSESRSKKVGSSDASSNCLAKYRWRAVAKPTAGQHTLVLLMPTKGRELGLEGAGHKPHQDHITAKRDEFYNSLQSCSHFHSDASSIEKIQMQRQQWRENGKTGENPGMAADESLKHERRDRWIQEWGQKGSFCVIDGPQYQKCEGRVVLRGDIVKDDSGSCAVFTEGSSAPHMTAAKVMDIISRLPGCSGQAADAVPAYTQVKMEDAPNLLKIPKSECPDIWRRLPKHKWPKSWSGIADPVVSLERNLYGHPLAGISWERQFGKVLLEHGWEEVLNWECSFVNGARGFGTVPISVCGRYQTGRQDRKQRTNLDNFHERRWSGRTYTISVYLRCAQRGSVKWVIILWQATEICSNPGFLLEPRTVPVKINDQSFRETWCRNDIFMVLPHGRSCEEMCGKILRTCE